MNLTTDADRCYCSRRHPRVYSRQGRQFDGHKAGLQDGSGARVRDRSALRFGPRGTGQKAATCPGAYRDLQPEDIQPSDGVASLRRAAGPPLQCGALPHVPGDGIAHHRRNCIYRPPAASELRVCHGHTDCHVLCQVWVVLVIVRFPMTAIIWANASAGAKSTAVSISFTVPGWNCCCLVLYTLRNRIVGLAAYRGGAKAGCSKCN